MKNTLKYMTSVLLIVCLSVFAISCSDSDQEPSSIADRTELNALIEECKLLLSEATDEDYPVVNIAIFTKLLDDVVKAADNDKLTQNEANSIVTHLSNGRNIFEKSAYGSIPDEAAIMILDFESADPNQLQADGTRGLVAQLASGPSEIFGSNTTKPTYVSGVNGGKAIHFANGSHLEIVNYNANDFLGNTMTIATWLKPDQTKNANYVASMNYWNNWKLEIEGNGKPFFTVKTTKGHADADNEKDRSVTHSKWTHLVISIDLVSGKLIFFIDGKPSKEWTVNGKPALGGAMPPPYQSITGKKLPFMIGAATTYEEAQATWDWTGWDTPTGWSYFEGAMDNFTIYNIALTEGQVGKLFREQQPRN